MVAAPIRVSNKYVKWALIGRQIGRCMKIISTLLDEGADVKYTFLYSFSRSDTG
jgi:hypothetical protein